MTNYIRVMLICVIMLAFPSLVLAAKTHKVKKLKPSFLLPRNTMSQPRN